MKNLYFALLFMPVFAFTQAPTGHIAHYLLDNNLTDIGGNNYNGSLSSTSGATDRFGNAGKATAFVQGSSSGQLPGTLQTAMRNSFSFSFWFNTSMTANSSGQWYGGNALFDAEVCGVTSDWGIALIDGGKVCFGIGGDVTVKSTLDYNDGNWHFLSATRNQAAGSITLYIDGVQVAGTTGTYSGDLTAPAFIGLGRNQCDPTTEYTGRLDEVIIYGRELTSTEIADLYNFSASTTLPLHWVSFSGKAKENTVTLNWEVANMVNNEYFEIEYSKNGQPFTKATTVTANNDITSYSYTLNNLQNSNYQFRIKQVDLDNNYSYSKIIALAVNDSRSSMYVLRNPAASELVIMNPAAENVQQVIITDVAGRRISMKFINSAAGTIKTTIASLKNGYYQVSLLTTKNRTTLPFIKQ